jgi:hypothetical protein
MKFLTTVLFFFFAIQNITAQEIFIPSDKSGISFSGGVVIDPDINGSAFGFSVKTKGNFILGFGYGRASGDGSEGDLSPNSEGVISSASIGIGYIAHGNPQKKKSIIFYPSLTYSAFSSEAIEYSTTNLSMRLLKIFGRTGSVHFVPNVGGGLLYSAADEGAAMNLYWGFGFDFGINITERYIWGLHFSRTNIIVNTQSFGISVMGMSFSVILK